MAIFRTKHGLLTSCCCLLSLSACKPSYSTYEDCILHNVKANQTQEAVLAIREACEVKFPEPLPSQEEITAAHQANQAAAAVAQQNSAQQAVDAAAQAADAAAKAADSVED